MIHQTIGITAALALAALTPAAAQFPVQDMDARSLGFGYSFVARGQTITDASVAANEVVHEAILGYAPVPYVSLQVGLGLDRFSVEPYEKTRFRGSYGFSPSLRVSGFSPAFAADVLRASGGIGLRSLSSENSTGYRYSAFVSNPFLGLIVSPTIFLDATVGVRGHFVDGVMEAPRSTTETSFANNDIARGYLALTLKTPFERAFLHLDMDFSPEFDADWTEGPREASVSVALGAVLGWTGKTRTQPRDEKPTYFPAYPEMKDRQDKMAEELE